MAEETGELRLHKYHLFLISLPVSVFVAAELVLGVLSNYPITFNLSDFISQLEPNSSAAEAAQRLRMLGLFLILFFVSLAIAARFEIERRKLFDTQSRRLLLLAIAVCVTVGVVVIALALLGIGSPRAFDQIGRNVFSHAFSLSATQARPMTESTFNILINGSGLIVILAVSCLIVMAISCLATPNGRDIELQKKVWRYQSERLQFIVYVATALLVIGVFSADSWTRWPRFVFVPVEPANEYISLNRFKDLASAYVVYTGIQNSLLLASFALPVGYLLSLRGDTIAEGSYGAKHGEQSGIPTVMHRAAVADEKKSEKLSFSLLEQVKALLAILAPFLAGTLGNIIGLVGA